MGAIIDRRGNGDDKSTVNEQRFIKRYRDQIRHAVAKVVTGRKVMGIEQSGQVSIPVKDISEPMSHHGSGGCREGVHPGNKEFIRGDGFDRSQQDSGSTGSQISDSGEGKDDLIFTLSREDFLNFSFEDMALSDLAKRSLAKIAEVRKVRAGFSLDGTPPNLSILRTMRSSIGRRIALSSPYQRRLHELERKYNEELENDGPYSVHAQELMKEMRHLRSCLDRVPFIEKFDLHYSNRVLRKRPQVQAVIFCAVDVSGSMDESRKDLTRRFFMLLYLLLKWNYGRIDVVFIRHHTVAKEVDEEDFFHSRESGGTVVPNALKLMAEMMQKRYSPSQWDIYCAQASDGDNWAGDSELCAKLLHETILPLTWYYTHVEVVSTELQNLWEEYLTLRAGHDNFTMQRILEADEIYPVLHELFQKRTA